MSGVEKLFRCSQEYRSTPEERSRRILFCAFFVFSVATLLFVSYVAVDHAYERNKLENEIERLESHLEDLRVRGNNEYSEDDGELSKKITDMIEKQRRCDSTYSVLELMAKDTSNLNGEDMQNLHIWSSMPKPFLYLSGSKIRCEQDKANVDGMETVAGWEIKGGGDCAESDPQTDGKDIVIPRDGNYSVFSQLTFYHKSGSETVIHRHAVQYIEVFATLRDTPRILMENDYQLTGDGTKVSYQAGVYRFNIGDILRVLVSKDPTTELHGEKSEEEATFGVYIL